MGLVSFRDWSELFVVSKSNHTPRYLPLSLLQITNAIFVICPPILMCLFHPYGRRVTQRIHIVWGLMIVVGLSSAYFHGTLTLAGQLLDEYGIIWMVMACFAFWFPKNILPESLEKHRLV